MSIPIKILLATRPLVPPWDEASKNFAYFLAKSIRDPQLEFHLLTAPETLEGLGTNCVQHPIFRSGRFDFEAKARLAAFLGTKGRSFDIVHFLFTPTPLNTFLARHLVGTRPKTVQTIATLREERWNETDWKRMFFANRLVTYTNHSKQKLEEAGFANVDRIYPGIDLEQFSPKPKDPKTLATLNLSPNDFVISYVGEYARLGATDMIVDMLVKHLPKTPTRHLREDVSRKGLKFLFALRVKNESDAKKKEEITEKFRQAGILDSIRFSDTVSDVAALYNIADIVTFPVADMHGKFDVPLVILEAYACSRPVILSDLSLFREFSNPRISATIPPCNSEALWQKISEIQRDSDFSKDLGANALIFVKEYFNLKNTAESYSLFYQNLKV